MVCRDAPGLPLPSSDPVSVHYLSLHYLARILNKGSPPPALSGTLLKKWAPGAGGNGASETSVCLLLAAVDITVGAQVETRRTPHEIFLTITGRHTKRVY